MERISFKDRAEQLERDDHVEVTLEDGRTLVGTVCKSNAGGVRVISEDGGRLYVVKSGGVVKRTHPDGGSRRLRRDVGTAVDVEVVGAVSVRYDQREGWTHN